MESLTPVVNYILEGEFPKEFTAGQRRKLIKQASTFLWLEGALYQKGKDLVCRRVPSTNEIPKILKGLHEEACGGHFSHELTLKKVLLAGYVWPSMHADVQHWCRSCHNCQVNGNKRLLYGPRQAVIANGPFEKWGIDAMGPLPRTANGKLYILVAIDYMTRWVEAQSVAKVNEKTVSKFVYTHICCRFGTPLEIVSDNGPGFRRGLITEHIERSQNEEAHEAAEEMITCVFVVKANARLYHGREMPSKEVDFLLTSILPEGLLSSKKYAFMKNAKKYKMLDDVLYMKGSDLVLRRVPWKEEIYKILEENREGSCGGHFAMKIMLHKILQEGYVWPSIQRDVNHWCKSCLSCQKMGKRISKPELRKTILAFDVFEKWGLDAIGPLPMTGRRNAYILTAVDYLSRWAEAKAVKQITSKEMGKFFVYEQICCKFGVPLELLSDRGLGFRGELFDFL
ncbi:hypothetical protein L7F22_008236 [Adiantum nelumboides]|nr:hypothetical protein [Adiantum nelumboides]